MTQQPQTPNPTATKNIYCNDDPICINKEECIAFLVLAIFPF